MSFRLRIAVAAAAAVAFAVAMTSGSAYVVLRHFARQEIDRSLVQEARRLQDSFHLGDPEAPIGEIPIHEPAGQAGGFDYQLLAGQGQTNPRIGPGPALPVTEAMRRVAAGERAADYSDVRLGGIPRRVLTVRVAPGVALQVARQVGEVDRNLRLLAIVLALVGVAGVGMGAGLGWLVSRAATGPLVALNATVNRATATGDLSAGIDVSGQDDLARLGRSFNALLQSLDQSLRSQRQLVVDASHELRTPLTSLRTNVEVLARAEGISPGDRKQLVGDVLSQFEELSVLLGDLTELAREDECRPVLEELRLDHLVESVAQRMAPRARAADVSIRTRLSPTLVLGSPSHLERATANLLDNALKWSPAGGSVEISVSAGEITVRDHGPGIAAEDLPLVFERFYRAPEAQELPGSGLGLAIVRQIAENHGGAVEVETAPDGGARFRLRVPPAPQPPGRRAPADGRAR